MELRHLEHFLAVAEEASFTRAAQRLHIVQSALSVSIKTLERDLGCLLFDRSTHHVRLTDEGVALLPEARRTLMAADAARDSVAAVRGGLRGTVRLGIMHSLALIDVASVLVEFHRRHPQVQLEPHDAPGGSATLIDDVAQGRLDLAFAVPGSEPPAGLDVRTLATEQLLLACPPGHRLQSRRRIRLEELEDEQFVDFPRGWGTRRSVDRLFVANGLRRGIAVEIADIPNVINLVRAGFGCAFFGPSMVPSDMRSELKQVRPAPDFTVALFSPPDAARPSAAVRAFRDLVFARFPDSPQPDRS